MKPSDHAPGYVPNAAYSQADWDEVSDNPELTAEQLAQMHLGSEGLPPNLAAALDQRGRRPQGETGRVQLTLSVDPDVLAAYKAGGPGWQARMNAALAEGIARGKRRTKAVKRG
ncbi:BrnA antitoxin family protein [Methylobacterium sp. J-072]|uniref:BrnA antitoxin family protein n=1 Tax=Methylobacterium sp. J-072 TaxID=2836651 RepID=UPI001FBA62F7|nr:BrnA antitoxin family protein [Methylobacterium sp. J-072]MCJ2096515.1 BrnA antitoxin family protein [Methylobacterium sp. J-072]